jgi:hypothetical protein
MRRTIFAFTAAFVVMTGTALIPQQADAMPAAPGLAGAVGSSTLVQEAAYVCRPIWRCGRFGCGWRRVCYWTHRGPHWGRPYWRHRHWRRHRW